MFANIPAPPQRGMPVISSRAMLSDRVRSLSPWAIGVIVVVMGITIGTVAQADDSIAAEALFREGRELMKGGRAEEACPKFQASMAAEPSVGALLNLARCHTLTGRVASAWAEYNEAAAMAHRAGQPDREKGALAMAAQLERRLPRVTVKVVAEAAGLEVLRDGEPMVSGALGATLPIDPGTHVFEARAPGKQAWRTELTLAEGETKTVTVPPLEPAATPAGPEPDEPAADDPLGSMTIAGIVVASVGAAALGVGIGLGVKASSDASALEETCPDRVCPGAEAGADDIRPLAHGSTAAIVVGSAAIAGGLVMILVGDDDAGPETGATAMLLPTIGGLSLSGRF